MYCLPGLCLEYPDSLGPDGTRPSVFVISPAFLRSSNSHGWSKTSRWFNPAPQPMFKCPLYSCLVKGFLASAKTPVIGHALPRGILAHFYFIFFNRFMLFIYLFLAALGLRCCTRAFSSCGERGLLFVVVRGLLIAVVSLVAEHWL